MLIVRLSFFQPAPLSEEKVSAMIEEKAKEIVEEVIAALKPALCPKNTKKNDRVDLFPSEEKVSGRVG